MWIKASGKALETIEADGFLELDLPKVLELLERRDWSRDRDQSEDEIAQALLDSRVDPPDANTRPSVESTLHALMPQTFVLHTHGELANGITCSKQGEKGLSKVNLPAIVKPVWIPYVDPGLPLAKALEKAIDSYKKKKNESPNTVFMAKHGILVAANTARDADGLLKECDRAIQKLTAQKSPQRKKRRGRKEFDEELEAAILPAIRARMPEPGLSFRKIDEPELEKNLAKEIAQLGPLLPDQVVYCGGYPLWIPRPMSVEPGEIKRSVRRAMDDYVNRYGKGPKVILIESLGAYAAGPSPKDALTTAEMYASAMRMRANTLAFGGPNPMTQREWTFIDNWSVEQYRRKQAAGSASQGRAAGKVVLVTGAAQGVGKEIAILLAAEGASLVLTDLNTEALHGTVGEINDAHSPHTAIGVEANVTLEDSMRNAVRQAVRTYGGLDVLISNAGILKAFKVTQFPVDVWRSIVDVNLVGFLICARVAAEVMQYQGSGNIIQINSKSGKAGSKYNSAYAASKFGGIGLTQSLALDLIEDGIRVNAICPGNFLDLPLWSAPGGLFDQYRAKFNNAPREEVRKIYEGKVPMGRGCRVEDVMKTILYILDQSYETGQAYNVTGGQEMR
jgi:NAD(P)-dependent dehydrogenase (short-subunit alcohol dehydrogenase family)/rhamnose utilization protein RhaD (predicted bifunctional aldolase and dehydrogenase)